MNRIFRVYVAYVTPRIRIVRSWERSMPLYTYFGFDDAYVDGVGLYAEQMPYKRDVYVA
jgi:hypothetical protein